MEPKVLTNGIPQCIHIPDGSVVVSGELFDQACAAINERDKLLAELAQLDTDACAERAERESWKHAFKNFHRQLCERFGYTHDEKDWLRDQVSLIEHIAKRNAHEPKPNAGVKCSHCNGKGVPDQIYDERRGGWSAPDIPCETCYGKGRIYTVEQYLKTLPADWHEDSSLQTWFPLTSEEREADRLDANRYRWLKRYLCESGESFREVAFEIAHDKPKADWDAAIDAELASAQRT